MAELAELITALNSFVTKLGDTQKKSSAPKDTLLSTNVNFEVFDENNESFDCYVQRLDNFFKLKGLVEDDTETQEAKVVVLINCIGAKNYQLLSSLTAPDTPASKTYTELINLLRKHLSPKPNILTEQHKFFSRNQRPGESITFYITALRELTKNANFVSKCETDDCTKNLLNIMLRAQFIRGLNDSDIREKILQQTEITFENSVEIALAIESSKLENAQLYKSFPSASNINKISTRKSSITQQHVSRPSSRNRTHFQSRSVTRSPNNRKKIDFKALGLDGLCIRCGSNKHYSDKCTAQKLYCKACKKRGHVVSVCLSELLKKKNNTSPDNRINQVFNGDFQEIEINRVGETKSINSNDDRFLLTVKINGKDIEFECDSGSRYSLMNVQQFNDLNINCPIKKTNVVFKSYTKNSFKPVGIAEVNVTFNGKSKLKEIYLVGFDKNPILGRSWMRDLNIQFNEIKLIQNEIFNKKSLVEKIVTDYSDVFESKIGKIPNYTCSLKLRENSKPIFIKPRPIPYSLKQEVEKELDKLEEQQIIEKVDISEWGTPIVVVPKADGSVRICADYKVTVNKQLYDSRHPIPRIEDIFNKLCDGVYYCTLDIHKAYLHLMVDDESSKIQTISTHRGTYLAKRLFFGIKNAPNEFHKFIDQFVQELEGVVAYFDDIIIQGKTIEECKNRLLKVLDKLKANDLHLNLSKCKFFEKEVKYLGHVISEKGLSKSLDKIKAIQEISRPTNVDEVRKFLGMMMYYSKFIKDASHMLYPLNRLLRNNVRFHWSADCEAAFIKAKTEIASDRILIPFNPDLPVTLATDASPYGISGVLSHSLPDGSDRPIAFASRSLTSAERNYSQLDKEATAVFWSCRKFFDYLYGRQFTLIVDNKPMMSILHPEKKLPILSSTRMLRYAQFLSNFNYSIIYRKSNEHINADFLSRNPIRLSESEMNSADEEYFVQENIINLISTETITAEVIKKETAKHQELSLLKENILNGKIQDPVFTVQDGILFRGHRVMIPPTLQQGILEELHSTHVGIVKMKALARNYCYWKCIDSDIENLVKSCKQCCDVKKDPTKAPTHVWEAPEKNWQRIHMDYAGPFLNHYFLLVIDAKSKWPEIYAMKQTPTSSITIKYLREIFSRHGLPEILVSDNATIFKSYEFQEFCRNNGIRQRLIAPGHPATNGQAERYVHTLKTKLKCMMFQPGTLHEKLCDVLMRYRATPLYCGRTPAELLLGNNIRIKLDLIKPIQHQKEKQQFPNFKKSFRLGNRVQSRNYTHGIKWKYGTIVEKLGNVHYLVELDDGYIIKRHFNQLLLCEVSKQKKRVTFDIHPQTTTREISTSDLNASSHDSTEQKIPRSSTANIPSNVNPPATDSSSNNSGLRRSTRIRKPIERLNYGHKRL